MKGVVLAGGTGSRLFPLTKITNKHLLPIYDKPMIYYPIQTLVDAGIRDILIVTGGSNAGDFLRLLANGKEFGLTHLNYTYQEGEGGIADALSLAEHFADGAQTLRDPRRQHHRRQHPRRRRRVPPPGARRANPAQGSARRRALRRRRNRRRPHRRHRGETRAARNRTTPSPASTCTTTRSSTRSTRWFPPRRGELEITDVNNAYIREGTMTFAFLDGWWTDAGTFESLLRAGNLVAGSDHVGEAPAQLVKPGVAG